MVALVAVTADNVNNDGEDSRGFEIVTSFLVMTLVTLVTILFYHVLHLYIILDDNISDKSSCEWLELGLLMELHQSKSINHMAVNAQDSLMLTCDIQHDCVTSNM